jgi:hypothetical protein
MTTIVAIFADTHIGSTVALCPPTVTTDDGMVYHPSKAQSWLWACWLDYWHTVEQLAEQHNQCHIIAIMNGDLFENQHHQSSQIWSLNPQDWQNAAHAAFSIIPHDIMYILRGTEAHSGPSAHLEEQFAKAINAARHPDHDTYSHWHLDIEIEHVHFDICHKGPIGRLPWTRPNALNRLAYEIIDEALHHQTQPPHIAIRAHNHIAEENSPRSKVRVFALPSWQLRTAYVDSKGLPRIADIGALIFICEAGSWTAQTKLYRPSHKTNSLTHYSTPKSPTLTPTALAPSNNSPNSPTDPSPTSANALNNSPNKAYSE